MEQRWKWKSDEFHKESLAQHSEQIIVYDLSSTTEKLEIWLEKFSPSSLSRKEGIGYIAVTPCSDNAVKKVPPPDLFRAWETLCNEEENIAWKDALHLAEKYDLKQGKWIFMAQTGPKANCLWKRVATSLVHGELGRYSTFAKITARNDDIPNYKHAISIRTDDFTDRKDVMAVEQCLRRAGVKCMMKYKPNINSHLGIYRKNDWNILPTLYHSVYDVRNWESVVHSTDGKYPAHQRGVSEGEEEDLIVL